MKSDIIEEYSEELVKKLRAALQSDIKNITMMWHVRSRQYEGINIAIGNYYQSMNGKI
ncbi:MAG: hypothetical protein ACTSO9_10350 [Candidatus Helarchaeota archaeon]